VARTTFGGTLADYVVLPESGVYRRPGSVEVTVWDAQTGGTQLTDLLLLDGTPVTSLRTGSEGLIPAFRGPDEVKEAWYQVAGASQRQRIATGARGPAGQDGAPGGSDAAMAAWINDEDSQTRASLSERVVAEATPIAATAIVNERSAAARRAGVFIPSPTAATRWHELRTATLAGQRQAHIALLADSIGYGAAATGATQPKPGKTTAGLMRASLARKYGAAGGGFTLADNVRLFGNLADDPRWAKTSGVVTHNFGFHASSTAWRIQTVGGAEYIEFTDTCSEFWIYTLSGGSQMQVKIDGGAAITLLNAASVGGASSDIAPEPGYYRNPALNAHNVFKIPAGAVGSHTLRIYPITSGSVFLVAVEGRIPTLGTFRVSSPSINGKALSTFFAFTGEGADGNGGLFSGDLWLDTLRADLLLAGLGVNDWQQQVSLATTRTRLERLIDRQRATGTNAYGSTKPGGDVVLIWNPKPDIASLGGGTYTNPSWDQYRDLWYEVAAQRDVCLIDLGDQWGGSFAAANARGQYADAIHPSDKGYLDYAARVEHALFNVI
jgi:lysophospholipase L1-like esterase